MTYCKDCWGIGEQYRARRDAAIELASGQQGHWDDAAKAAAKQRNHIPEEPT